MIQNWEPAWRSALLEALNDACVREKKKKKKVLCDLLLKIRVGKVQLTSSTGMFTYHKDSRCHWFSSFKCDNYSEFRLVGAVSFYVLMTVLNKQRFNYSNKIRQEDLIRIHPDICTSVLNYKCMKKKPFKEAAWKKREENDWYRYMVHFTVRK